VSFAAQLFVRRLARARALPWAATCRLVDPPISICHVVRVMAAHDTASAAPRVLVVDDTADTRELYAMCFRHDGFDVAEAEDGLEAIASAQALPPDVIIMDLAMPRLDGWLATKQLKAHHLTRDSLVLVVTGQVIDADLQRARDAGADEVLTKPCSPRGLLARVRALLAAR
jgi:CheY-like chemotaxis protein